MTGVMRIAVEPSRIKPPPLPVPPTYRPPPDYVIVDDEGRVPIRVRAHIMSLQKIDTVDQQFDCKLWIQLKWLTKKRNTSEIDVTNEWRPKLEFQDNVGELKIDECTWPRFEDHGDEATFVYNRWVVQGSFAERLELQDFPLDHQQLHIRAIIWGSPSKLAVVPGSQSGDEAGRFYDRRLQFYRANSCVYHESFVQRDAWKLRDMVFIGQALTQADRNDHSVQFPVLDIYVVVERKVSFFIWNVMFPVFLLVLLSFISFVMDSDALADRMAITLTLVLTLVAFKFVVSQYLPATSYLTNLDKYVIVSFAYLVLVALQNVLTQQISPPDVADSFNNVSALVLIGTWTVLNFLSICMLAQKERLNQLKAAWFESHSEDAAVGDEVPAVESIQNPVTACLAHNEYTIPEAKTAADADSREYV